MNKEDYFICASRAKIKILDIRHGYSMPEGILRQFSQPVHDAKHARNHQNRYCNPLRAVRTQIHPSS